MTYKTNSLAVLAAFFCCAICFSNQCDNFYAKVTYGLSHSKKALGATNFEHQMYYAERALTALEKSKSYMAECGCQKSEDKTLDAIESLTKAIEPVDWDAGRYYSKKSIGIINELITILDECTLGNVPVVVEDSENTTLENEAYSNSVEKSQASMEMEMLTIFKKHSKDKLETTQKAVEQLVLFSQSFKNDSKGDSNDPNSLSFHQKSHLENARQLLEDGLKALNQDQ